MPAADLRESGLLLQAEVGDYISATQIEALLVRRDRILEACSPSGAPRTRNQPGSA